MIENEAQLRALAKAVRAGQTFFNKNFQLKNDIENIVTSIEKPWMPIGTSQGRFEGKFNGDGKTVSGVFYLSDKDGERLGFFGTGSGPIRNLTVDGDIIYRSTTPKVSSAFGIDIGGISGATSYPMTNCTHIGSMIAENTEYTGKLQMGGIVGAPSSHITGCTQRGGTISANIPKGSGQIGGIVGDNASSVVAIHTCHSESSITVKGKSATSFNAGALVGNNKGMVYGCSTFSNALTITVNDTAQSPVKAIGSGNPIDETEHTD